MSRITGPKCKLCRLEGLKLFLRGERCYSEKCAMNRKPYPPGRTASFSSRRSIYGLSLREKQKVKRVYGLTETQMKDLYERASTHKGDKGLRLLQYLEMRLDNVIFLLGLAPSRAAARQVVNHGKVSVNDKKITIPSYITTVGNTLRITDQSLQTVRASGLKTPPWLKSLSKGGEVIAEPSRDMIDEGIRENLIIEFYSR
jgi:small subunit ribosomal protein S4